MIHLRLVAISYIILLLGLSKAHASNPDSLTEILQVKLEESCFREFATTKADAEHLIQHTQEIGDFENQIYAHIQAGICFCALKHYEDAFSQYEDAESLIAQFGDSISTEYEWLEPALQMAYGDGYHKIGDDQRAIELYQPLVEYYEDRIQNDDFPSDPNSLQVFGHTFITSGLIYIRLGEYEKALRLFQFIVDAQPNSSRSGHARKLSGDAYVGKKAYRQAEASYLQALAQNEQGLSRPRADMRDTNRYIITCLSMARMYSESPDGSLEQSKQYLQRAEEIFYGGNLRINMHHAAAQVYQRFQNYEASAYHYGQMLELQQKAFGPQSIQAAKVHRAIGDLYLEQQEYQQAQHSYQEAIGILTKDADKVAEMPVPPDVQFKRELMATLIKQTKALRANEGAAEAWQTSLWAQALADSLKSHYIFGQDQIALIKESYEMYEDALGILAEMGQQPAYLEQAYQIMSKSKNLLLLESLKRAEASQQGIIPSDLLDQERSLQLQLTKLNQDIITAKRKNPQHPKIEGWSNQLFVLQTQHKEILDSIKSHSQLYFDVRYAESSFGLAELQSTLAPNQLLLEFFEGKEHLYVLAADQQSVQSRQIPLRSELSDAILTIRSTLNTPPPYDEASWEAGYDQYVQSAHLIYEQLLADLLSGTDIDQLILVPDGNLAYVPFEALLTQTPTNRHLSFSKNRLDYLLEEVQITYAYSSEAYVRQQSRINQSSPSRLLAGFAPKYPETGLLASTRGSQFIPASQQETFGFLPNSKQELRSVGSLFDPAETDLFFDENASEGNFRTYGSQARILHFSMHSYLNDSLPMFSGLVFDQNLGAEENRPEEDDGILFAYELFGMNLPSDLAVLAVCGSQAGPYQPGQGLASLAKAFAFAGCRSMVASLWQADDLATSNIMRTFYQFLLENQSKDQALRQAKLSYLDANDMSQESYHPYYWANFIQIGDPAPIVAFNWWYQYRFALLALLMIALSLGLAAVSLRMRKKRA